MVTETAGKHCVKVLITVFDQFRGRSLVIPECFGKFQGLMIEKKRGGSVLKSVDLIMTSLFRQFQLSSLNRGAISHILRLFNHI